MDADRSESTPPDGGADRLESEPRDGDTKDGGVGATAPIEDEGVEDRIARLFRNGRTNALFAWAMVAVLAGVFVESLLDVDLLSLAIITALGAVVLAPPVSARDWRVMLPSELLVLALLPVLVGALLGGELGTFATYVSLAAVALVITVELHMFTSLRVKPWFAVVLVVMTTMATAAAWAILRWNADRLLGTNFLTTNEALMIEWIYVTLAGIAAGVLFEAYFRRRGRQLRRAIWRVVRR